MLKREPCKDSRLDRDGVQNGDWGSRNHVLDGDPDPPQKGAVLGRITFHLLKITGTRCLAVQSTKYLEDGMGINTPLVPTLHHSYPSSPVVTDKHIAICH